MRLDGRWKMEGKPTEEIWLDPTSEGLAIFNEIEKRIHIYASDNSGVYLSCPLRTNAFLELLGYEYIGEL